MLKRVNKCEMNAKKTITMGAGIFLLVFCGVLAGLHIDRTLRARGIGNTAEGLPVLRASNVQLENGQLTVPADFQAASKRIMPSVVSITTFGVVQDFFSDQTRTRQLGTGSGVIISADGYILTNNHVIQGARSIQVKMVDGKTFTAKLVGADARSDLALLDIEATGLKAATMGDSSDLQIGEWVMAVGSPLGYDNTLSVGVVSSLGRSLRTEGSGHLLNAIQTDAAINQGNSGGALATVTGELVGINSAIISPDGGSIGIGFAIPIAQAKRVADDLIKFGRVRYGRIGLNMVDADGILQDPAARRELMQMTNTQTEPPNYGVVINGVQPQGPADKAGLTVWSVITKMDDKKIETLIDFYSVMDSKRPGDEVAVTFWKAGQSITKTIVLAEESV